jgi:2-methylfumaryl-CoA isomerase
VRFAKDEGARFKHLDRLTSLIEPAIGRRQTAELTAAFEAKAVCWGPYQTLKQAVESDAYFSSANPVLSEIDHPSGYRYLAPGAAATLPSETRRPPAAAPILGRDTDEVLAEVLKLPAGEIARLHDAGIVAGGRRAEAS